MKKAILFLAIVFFSFKTNEEQKYVVTHTENDWAKYIQVLEIAKNQLKQSDVPAKYVLPEIDSISKMQDDFRAQIIPQLPKDSTKKK